MQPPPKRLRRGRLATSRVSCVTRGATDMTTRKTATLPYECIALVLQGGGALGAAPDQLSHDDTAPLAGTLDRLVDFERLNDKRGMRLTVSAVNVRSGNFELFGTGPKAWRICAARWRSRIGWPCPRATRLRSRTTSTRPIAAATARAEPALPIVLSPSKDEPQRP